MLFRSVDVDALVVVELADVEDIGVGEIVEARQDVAQPQDRSEEPDESLLLALGDDHSSGLEARAQLAHPFKILLEVVGVGAQEPDD